MGDICDYCYRTSVIEIIPKRSLTIWRVRPRRVCRWHLKLRAWRTNG